MRTLVTSVLAVFALGAASQEPRSGWYAGVEFANSPSGDPSTTGLRLDNPGATMQFFGGYQWNERWGLELSYSATRLGEPGTDRVDLVAAPFSAVYGAEIAALTVRPMAYLPMSWGTLFGGVGLFDRAQRGDARNAAQRSFGGWPIGDIESTSGATLLLGTEWPIGSLKLRAEYEWWDLERADSSSLGFGLSYEF